MSSTFAELRQEEMTEEQVREAQERAAKMLAEASIALTSEERKNIEVMELGLGELERTGLARCLPDRLSVRSSFASLAPNSLWILCCSQCLASAKSRGIV